MRQSRLFVMDSEDVNLFVIIIIIGNLSNLNGEIKVIFKGSLTCSKPIIANMHFFDQSGVKRPSDTMCVYFLSSDWFVKLYLHLLRLIYQIGFTCSYSHKKGFSYMYSYSKTTLTSRLLGLILRKHP